ncbi:GNAT family N-acetyltransferase [Bryobacter aggregatus]|uniref:GNAT family N-acetyltransferase n=1 Tax=Bryobacter aggregatus TaxID=360054 RepID=UPI0004E168D3|nr:GNAT family N-acetyltransferase [Bryobacter aggregatus]
MESIRPMLQEDLPATNAILQAAHQVSTSFTPLLRRNHALTPDSYWVLEEDGRPIGVVGYTDFGSFAHIGLMAILPSRQSHGAGSRLLSFALGQMEARGFRSITLYSTDAGLGFYLRHGFRWAGLSPEWQLRRRNRWDCRIRVERWEEAAEVAGFDAAIFGGDRQRLFRALLLEFPGRGLLVRDAAGQCAGFAIAQSGVIGPMAAATPEIALALLDAALDLPFEAMPRVLLPDGHAAGETALLRLGFVPVRVSRYLYHGTAPVQQRAKMYGQGAYSLG